MAGIGFELRKIFGKKTLVSNTWGVIYASMTSIGPSLMFLLLLFSLRFLMRYFHATELETLFFTGAFTYACLVAILVSACFNTVVSRYISDKIFEEKDEELCASMFGVLTLGSVISGGIATVFCFLLAKDTQVSLRFLVAYYLLIVLATDAYHMITYVSAVKEYKKVTLSYFAGICVSILTFFLLYKIVEWHILLAIFWALAAGFFIIDLLLVCVCVKAFGKPGQHYASFMRYFVRYPKLLVSGFAYMLGFYLSNIIYWFCSDMRVTISIFRIAPNYDLAMFLGILVNLSGMVIFEVKTETTFYEKYVEYLSALRKGTYELVEQRRMALQNVINLQLFFLYEVQLIITVVLICLANVFYPYLGINNQILNMLMLLGMGLYCTFCMYFTVIFLYYFEDHRAACVGPVLFLAIVLIGSLLCCHLGEPYYPFPLLVGGLVGWIDSFIRLRKRLRDLNAYLLCR